MKNITKEQFNAIIFCMAQRAIQENKQKEFIQYIQEIGNNENICKEKRKMQRTAI